MHEHDEYIYCDHCHGYHKYEDLQKLWDSIYFEHVHYDKYNSNITNKKDTNPYINIIGGIALWAVCTTVTYKLAANFINKHL